jgi:replicative DNA helicase
MASPEHLLISKVIQTSDIHSPIKSGVRPEHFSGQWSEIWKWMTEYSQKHSAAPSRRLFAGEFGDVDLYDASKETFSGLIEEIFGAYTQRKLIETISSVMPKLNDGLTTEALQELSSGVQQAAVDVSKIRDVDIVQTWESRLERYEELRSTPNGIRGIPTGFYGLDRITQGLRPQQFIVIAGEPKRGKSWIALILAISAHIFGVRPMFVSFEMSIEEQEARYDALIAKVGYGNVLSGQLTNAEMERIRKAMSLRKNMQPFIISEDTASLTTVGAISAKVREYRPDVLFVDGVYLMDDEHGEPKGSPQALTNITRSLKRLAQAYDIPVIATTQVLAWKLNNKKSRAVTADALGYSSSFAQDADLLLSVERNPDIEDRSIIRVVIARSSPTGEVHIHWDWDTMSFDEVHGGDDDDDD